MSVISSSLRPARRRSSTRLLRRALAHTGRSYGRGGRPSLRDLLTPLGTEASALGAALLALPLISPVSLGPITTSASILIAFLGVQLLRRDPGAPLPERLLAVPLPEAAHRLMTAVLRRARRWLHRISRPRLAHLVEGRRGRVLCGGGILAGALLLALPIPLLPLTNTFPALAVLLFALGWLEGDGLLTVLGSASLAVSALLFAAIGLAVTLLGWEVVRGVIPIVSAL